MDPFHSLQKNLRVPISFSGSSSSCSFPAFLFSFLADEASTPVFRSKRTWALPELSHSIHPASPGSKPTHCVGGTLDSVTISRQARCPRNPVYYTVRLQKVSLTISRTPVAAQLLEIITLTLQHRSPVKFRPGLNSYLPCENQATRHLARAPFNGHQLPWS